MLGLGILPTLLFRKRHGTQFIIHNLVIHEYKGLHKMSRAPTKQLVYLNSYKRVCGNSRFGQGYKTDVRAGSLLENHKEEEGFLSDRPKTSAYFAYQQEQFLTQQLEAVLPKAAQLTKHDWKRIKADVLKKPGGINTENVDAIFLNKCSEVKSLLLGKSYFDFLRSETPKLNRAVYGNYLRLFYECAPDCDVKDYVEIINVYEELVRIYPLLDSYTTEKAILALSITDRWTEYKKLFKTIERFYHPSSQVYSVIIKAAFRNKDLNTAWELLKDAQFRHITINDDVFIFWICSVNDESLNTIAKLTEVLNFLKKFDIKPSVNLTEVIKQSFEKCDHSMIATLTAVSRRGVCHVCQTKLEPAWVSQEDFDELRSAFLDPVLIGKDIFLKTLPEEMNSFLSFLAKHGPFDIVLDGLNIAMRAHKDIKTPALFAFQLKSVVKHFLDCGQKVLVLGRKHMTKWPAKNMEFVYDNADMFLAEDISQDDPFLLYATLHSGLGTRFVSRDMMRGHKFLLANPKLQVTFVRWQAQHQYFLSHIENSGIVHLKEPIRFLQCIQQNSKGDWHIPYTVKENLYSKREVDNFHRQWLCLVKSATLPSRNRDETITKSMKPSLMYQKRQKGKFILSFEDLKK